MDLDAWRVKCRRSELEARLHPRNNIELGYVVCDEKAAATYEERYKELAPRSKWWYQCCWRSRWTPGWHEEKELWGWYYDGTCCCFMDCFRWLDLLIGRP